MGAGPGGRRQAPGHQYISSYIGSSRVEHWPESRGQRQKNIKSNGKIGGYRRGEANLTGKHSQNFRVTSRVLGSKNSVH